jgi:hypothetical protein
VRPSSRKQLSGTVTSINPGSVMSTVKVDVSGQEVTAAVTRKPSRTEEGPRCPPRLARLAVGPCTGAVRGRRR